MNQLRGYHATQIDGKDVGLRFNSNCFRLYSEMKGIELNDLGNISGSGDIRDLLWCAGRAWAEVTGKEFKFTVLQIEDWIDYMDDSEMGQILLALQSTKIFGQEIQAGKDEDEPKN